jgi:hypothetical protein
MVGLRVCVSGLMAFLLVGPVATAFDDWRPSWISFPYVAGVHVVPIPRIYAPVGVPCSCLPQVRYAIPTPAPTSPGASMLSSHEPPLGTKPSGKQGPTIYQSRIFSNVPQITEPRQELCKVTFWNLSGADLKLSVGDQPSEGIAKDRAKTIPLQRHFAWQTDRHPSKTEAIADDVNHFDVLIK